MLSYEQQLPNRNLLPRENATGSDQGGDACNDTDDRGQAECPFHFSIDNLASVGRIANAKLGGHSFANGGGRLARIREPVETIHTRGATRKKPPALLHFVGCTAQAASIAAGIDVALPEHVIDEVLAGPIANPYGPIRRAVVAVE